MPFPTGQPAARLSTASGRHPELVGWSSQRPRSTVPSTESVQPVMMIECPRLLVPYAREIVSSVVRNGGFPPLMIDPVDFVSLYRQKMAQKQQGAPAN